MPDAACRSACVDSSAWAAAWAVADIIEGTFRSVTKRISWAMAVLRVWNLIAVDKAILSFARSFCPAGKDAPVSALPPHEVENWRQNHVKRPLCGCFGSFCVST